jgi:hypothetical protein
MMSADIIGRNAKNELEALWSHEAPRAVIKDGKDIALRP